MLDLLAGIAIAQVKAPAYAVIYNKPDAVVVKIDPRRADPHIFTNTSKLPYTISFNANYFWRGTPIGLLMDRGRIFYAYQSYIYDRPCLFIGANTHIGPPELSGDPGSVVVQAGPTLVKNGQVSIRRTEENFQSDVTRTTAQVSVGVTGAKKLIVAYTLDWSITKIANYLVQQGCTDALKMDGGSSSFLSIKDLIQKGRRPPITVGVGLNLH